MTIELLIDWRPKKLTKNHRSFPISNCMCLLDSQCGFWWAQSENNQKDTHSELCANRLDVRKCKPCAQKRLAICSVIICLWFNVKYWNWAYRMSRMKQTDVNGRKEQETTDWHKLPVVVAIVTLRRPYASTSLLCQLMLTWNEKIKRNGQFTKTGNHYVFVLNVNKSG